MTEKRNPLISVVMPVYNGERYLAEAIESILAQTVSDLELVIVDDCSADGSVAIIRDYAAGDERIRFIQHERNLGLTSTRNTGIAASSGEFIAAMDHDDISRPQRIEKQADFLRSRPDIGVVGTGAEYLYEDMTARVVRGMPQHHALIILYWILDFQSVVGPTIMARRKLMLSVGGYDENIRAADDKELFSRLYGRTRFANLPDALYVHRRYAQQTSETLRDKQKSEGFAVRQRWLNRLWGEAPRACMERLMALRPGVKFNWRERRLLRRDLQRLINALYQAEIILDKDLPLLEAEMNRLLESAMPRRWQMFLHWRRHHFGSGKSEKAD